MSPMKSYPYVSSPMKSYPYVSHLLELPPDVATIGFDLFCHCLAANPRTDDQLGGWEITLRSGRLELVPPPRVGEAGRGYCALRTLPGTLRPPRRWSPRVAVNLEVLPWSATKSELALIAHPSRQLGWLPERPYLRLAHDLLHVVAHHLERAGDDPVAVARDDTTYAITSR